MVVCTNEVHWHFLASKAADDSEAPIARAGNDRTEHVEIAPDFCGHHFTPIEAAIVFPAKCVPETKRISGP